MNENVERLYTKREIDLLKKEILDLKEELSSLFKIKNIIILDQHKKIEKLEKIVIQRTMADTIPCLVCGYNGSGYFQPSKHPCAEIYQKYKDEISK